MSRALHPNPEDRDSPFPYETGKRIAAGVAMVAVMAAVLALMGRHPVCPCGTISFWQVGSDPNENSQQFSDWYSFLHVVFGMGLFGAVRFLKPRWSFGATLLAVVFGHSIWEVAENTPIIISLFSGGANAPHYAGDSILNSLGDTVFALGGAAATPFLPLAALLAVAAAAEIAVTFGTHDGFILGTLRLFGVKV